MQLSVKKEFSCIQKDAETALEDLAIAKLEDVESMNALREEITNLLNCAKKSVTMMKDLMVAKDSLETVGYSKEWFDIINQDGKFAAAIHLQAPRYFGGDEAKGKACMEGLIDTLKSWAKTAWEWIVKAWKAITGLIHEIYTKFFKEKKVAIDRFETYTDLLEMIVSRTKSDKDKYSEEYEAIKKVGVDIHAYDVLDLWMQSYLKFVRIYGDTVSSAEKERALYDVAGAVKTSNKSVAAIIFDELVSQGVSPDPKKSGIRLVGEELEFLNANEIRTEQFSMLDADTPVFKMRVKAIKDALNVYSFIRQNIDAITTRIIQTMSIAETNLETFRKINNVDLAAKITVNINLLQSYLSILGRMLTGLNKLTDVATRDAAKIEEAEHKVEEIGKKLMEASKK